MTMFEAGAWLTSCWLLVLATAVVLASGPPQHLAHISGSSRKMRMYIKNAFLQLKIDGTVVVSHDDQTVATVLQRSSVNLGQVKIQGVANCMYLCMDICGIPYSSKEFSDECIFNEKIEEHNYNTYSSTKYSNARRTLYLGMSKNGEARRVQVRTGTVLGKLSMYTRALTQPVIMAREFRTCPPSKKIQRPARCRSKLKRPRRRKKPINEGNHKKKCEDCGDERLKKMLIGRKRKSRLEQARKVRHRKHRTAVMLEESDEDGDESGDDVTMTTEGDTFEDIDLFLDRNENE